MTAYTLNSQVSFFTDMSNRVLGPLGLAYNNYKRFCTLKVRVERKMVFTTELHPVLRLRLHGHLSP
jgi:hypothetical protein